MTREATRAWNARRNATADPDFLKRGKKRQGRMDLGLALLSLHALPGQEYTIEEIAAWAGVPTSTIFMYQQRALEKLRRRLKTHPILKELMAEFFERRKPATRPCPNQS